MAFSPQELARALLRAESAAAQEPPARRKDDVDPIVREILEQSFSFGVNPPAGPSSQGTETYTYTYPWEQGYSPPPADHLRREPMPVRKARPK